MWARGAVWAAAVLLAATAAHAGGTLEAPPSLGGMRFGGSCSGGESGVQRLRGGFEAVMPLKPANLGTPNAWSGQNVGESAPALWAQAAWVVRVLLAADPRQPFPFPVPPLPVRTAAIDAPAPRAA